MKLFLQVQAGLLIAGILLIGLLYDWRAALSYGVGALFVLGNSALSSWLWGRLLQKKLVAVGLVIIVFKYAILGAILYRILQQESISPLWFSLGIANLVLVAALTAVVSNQQNEI